MYRIEQPELDRIAGANGAQVMASKRRLCLMYRIGQPELDRIAGANGA